MGKYKENSGRFQGTFLFPEEMQRNCTSRFSVVPQVHELCFIIKTERNGGSASSQMTINRGRWWWPSPPRVTIAFTDNISRFNYTIGEAAASFVRTHWGLTFPAYGTDHLSYSSSLTYVSRYIFTAFTESSSQSKCSKFNWIHKRTHFLHAAPATLHSFLFIFWFTL